MNQSHLEESQAKQESAVAELPKIVTIKIDTASLDEDSLEALRTIYVRDKTKLPFRLPRLMSWPSKERANGERAMILLKNGYLELVEKSSSSDNKLNNKATSRVGAEAKADFPVGPKEPEARIKF